MSAVIYVFILLILQVTTPFWWWVMAVPFVFFMIKGASAGKSFLVAGLGAGFVWLSASTFIYFSGGLIITRRVAEMIGLKPSWILIGITVLTAIIAAGISGTSGFFVRKVFTSRFFRLEHG